MEKYASHRVYDEAFGCSVSDEALPALIYNILMRYLVSLMVVLAVFYPLSVWYGRVGSSLTPEGISPVNLFPAFGLAAFSIMWLHVVGGALREWLSRYINFERFVSFSSTAVLLFIILHPLLLLIGIGVRNAKLVFEYNDPKYIWLGITAWFILVGYDISKRFKNKQFFFKHWDAVKLISTIGFFLVFFHSLGVGTDVQTGPLRYVWIFYGISAVIAATYTYGIKKFLRRG